MELQIPDGFPQLVQGASEKPEDGGCIMQVTSWLWNGEWHDGPTCVERSLVSFGIAVNDSVLDEDRNRMLHAVPNLMNTQVLRNALDDSEARKVYARIDEWRQANWPWENTRPRGCQCCKPSADYTRDAHDDFLCMVHDMEACISRAHEDPTAIGGGVKRWHCEHPEDMGCTIPGVAPLHRFPKQEPRHAHYTNIPARPEGSTELADFFVAFVQEWVDAHNEYVVAIPSERDDSVLLVTPEKWNELREVMTPAQ